MEKKEKEKVKKYYEPEESYGVDFQVALSISLIFFIIIFVSVKSLQVRPYKPKSEVATLVEQLPPELEKIKEPPPPPKPKLPVEVKEASEEEAEQEEVEIAPTTEFNELEVPPPPKTEEAYEFYAVEIKPQLVKWVEPKYPELARKAGIEGRVFVKVLVDTLGNVVSAEVVRSTNPVFDEAALKAARQCKFKPGYQRDRPVRVWMVIPFHFKLTK